MLSRAHWKMFEAWDQLRTARLMYEDRWLSIQSLRSRGYTLLEWLQRPSRWPHIKTFADLTPAEARAARRQLHGWRFGITPIFHKIPDKVTIQ